jgi:pimeloyl-ACP methyl ester carboxylesterase
MSTRPIVLAHGAWSGAWAWGFVAAELEKHGITPHTMDLPSSTDPDATLSADADAVKAVLAGLDEPAVLMGHSYCGQVITEASAGNDKVAHLAYLCAILPDTGDTTFSLMGEDPTPSTLGDAIRMSDDGTSTLDPDGARKVLFNDCTDDEAGPIIPLLGMHTMRVFGESASGHGWKEHPSTYFLTTNDLVFSTELQRRMAAHAGEIIELDAGHIPQLRCAAQIATELVRLATT